MYQDFNPMYNYYQPVRPKGANFFSNLKGKWNWNSILNNTQRTLNIINQAIPIYYQVRPMYQNMKTIFKIAGAVSDSPSKKDTTSAKKEINTFPNEKKETQSQNSLNFFL